MTSARAHLVDASVGAGITASRAVFGALFVLSEGPLDCKDWIELRLQELVELSAARYS